MSEKEDAPGRTGYPGTATAPGEVAEEQETRGEGWAVLLFNDSVHSMDEVAAAVCVAINCDLDTAWSIMLRAHKNGKAVVTIAERVEAERVASVLRSAKLTVEIKAV